MSQQLKDDLVTFMDEKEIDALVSRLAQEVEADYAGKEIHIICPLKGSIIFCSDFVKKINLPQIIDFVYLVSQKGKAVQILRDISEDIAGKHVIIVEEIIDVGRTAHFLKSRLALSNPASLKVVTLINKPSRREHPITPDYIGRTVDDRFVVGYGMDSEELGRNYKGIYNFSQ